MNTQRKSIYYFLYTFLFSGSLLPTPENPHHMDVYKQKKVVTAGPVSEHVTEIESGATAEAKYTYNRSGQLSDISYYKDGVFEGTSQITYGKHGVIKEVTKDINKKEIEIIDYIYASLGKLNGYTVKAEKDVIAWKFSYKGKNLVWGQRSVNNEVSESFKVRHRGKNQTFTLYNANGKEAGEIKVVYKKNYLVKRIRTDAGGSKIVRYAYSPKGNLVSVSFFNLVNGKEIKQKEHKLTW